MTLSSIFTHDGLHVMSKQILFATSFRGSQWHFLHQRQHHGFNLARCVSSRRLQRLFRMRSSLRSVFLTTSSTTILGSYSRSKLERTQRRWMLNTPTHGFGERDRPGDYVTGSGSGSGRRSSNEAFVDQVVRALTEHCGIRGGDKVQVLYLPVPVDVPRFLWNLLGQILVLVSGGSDSVALLLALHEASARLKPPLHLEAVHFNHALRGQDSDGDEAFVVDLAKKLEVRLHVRHWRGVDEGGTGGRGSGLQERARNWRRSEACAILDAMEEKGLTGAAAEDGRRGFIATAHHKDDQAETILLKALRGAHLTNLKGMDWKSPPFVRPLLEVHKASLVEFLNERGQGWREDSTNQEAKYTRNRVRLQLLPLLQDLAGGPGALGSRLEEVSRQSRLARQMVRDAAKDWEREFLDARDGPREDGCRRSGADLASVSGVRSDLFPLVPFLREIELRAAQEEEGLDDSGAPDSGNRRGRRFALPELVREELLHRFLIGHMGDQVLPYAQLRLLMRQVEDGGRKWSISLGQGLLLRRIGEVLQIQVDESGYGRKLSVFSPEEEGTGVARHEGNAPPRDGGTVDDLGPGRVREGGEIHPWKLVITPSLELAEEDVEDRESQGALEGVGARRARGEGMMLYNIPPGTRLRVRPRRDGDRFRPTWRKNAVKVKDFLRGQGVPLHHRDEVALICDDDDKVVAVYPSYPAAGFDCDRSGIEPIRVMVEGERLRHPRPLRAEEGYAEEGQGDGGKG